MKKILMVTGSLNTGGLEIFAVNTAELLQKQNYQFDFLIFNNQKQDLEEKVKKMGGNVIRIDNPKKGYIKFQKNFKKIIREYGPYDIVHSHLYYVSGIILKISKKLNIKTCIAHSHSIQRKSDKRIIKKIVHRHLQHRLNKYSDYKLACSYEAGINLFGYKEFNKSGIVVPNPINIDKFLFNKLQREKIRKSLNISKEKLVIGQVGRLADDKNQFFLLDILKKYNENNDAILLLVGDGPLKKSLQQYAAKIGIEKNVLFLGKRSDVNDLLSAMDIFVMTSLHEGLGMVILEAIANGLKCICEEHAVVEQIKRINNCISIKGFNVDDWVKTIEKHAEREKDNSYIKTSLVNYSEERFVEIMNNIYKSEVENNE